METFRVGEAVRFGWEKFKGHFIFLWTALGIVWGISIFFRLVQESLDKENLTDGLLIGVIIFIALLGFVLGAILQLGLIRLFIDLVDQDTEDRLKMLFSQHKLFWRYLGASVLYGLMVGFGLILLIVPGIYFALKYQFFSYLIVDKNLGVFDALKKSGEITKGVKWKLFGFWFALVGLNILGLLVLLVGLLVTIPTSILAYIYVYRTLSKRLVPAAVSAVPAETPMTIPAGDSAAR